MSDTNKQNKNDTNTNTNTNNKKYIVVYGLEDGYCNPPTNALTLEDIGETPSPSKSNPERKPKEKTKKPAPIPTRKPEASYKFQDSRTDKRVSLNCAPLRKNDETQDYIKRMIYVLGNETITLSKGQTVYGFLYNTLRGSCGLIFPYTPQISVNHSVSYERTEITHSNLAISHYKGTPPPTISMDATFTADTRDNALHMLSALWFLRAVTKCDFGERANVDANCVPGMPPPILYLNGYNQVMDNIPVVVTNFSYQLPKDKHYVPLGINLDSNVQAFNDTYLYSDITDDKLYALYGNATAAEGMKYLNGIANSIKSLQSDATLMQSNRYNNYYFNNWLPTELSFHIDLQIQPNLLKNKKNFDLNWYKAGIYNLDDYKGNVFIGTSTTYELEKSDCKEEDLVEKTIRLTTLEGRTNSSAEKKEVVVGVYENKKDAKEQSEKWDSMSDSGSYRKKVVDGKTVYEAVRTEYYGTIGAKKEYVNKNAAEMIGILNAGKSYKFDRSGWTW